MKPQLKKEIHVEEHGFDNIKIYPHSDKAKAWVTQYASEYGKIQKDPLYSEWYILELNPCYDKKEVMDYIRKMGA